MEEVIREGALRLLTSETSCDVILSCHGHRMMAHKVILSIASPLLRDLLLEDTTQPTVLIFPDISGNTMSLILDYIYTGNVAVPTIVLTEFLLIANLLKLKLDNEYLSNYATDLPQIYDNDDFNKKTKEVVSIDDILTKNETCKRNNINNKRSQSEPTNFTLNYLDDVRCRKGKKLPSLLPLTTLKKRKELFNKVFPSPWCPRGSPLLRHPREDCYASIYPLVPPHPLDQQSHLNQQRIKEITQEDTNNNNYQTSNYLPYNYNYNALTINNKNFYYNNDNNSNLIPRQTLLTNPIRTPSIEEIQETSPNNNLNSSKVPIIPLEKQNNNVKDLIVNEQLQEDLIVVEKDNVTNAINDEVIVAECIDNRDRQEETKNDKLKPFKCEDCGKGFSQLRNYKYHRSIHEGTKEFAARCPECGKTFNDKGYLSSHMKIHRDKKEYACPHCPKRFNQRVAYNMHLRIHTGLKPHECPTCGKSFSRKMLLKQHQRVHTGERPYTCPECGKSFADRSNMSLHARLHTGVKPYACTLCPKSFTKKHHLKTHMNFHTGLKPYTCQNCGLSFSQSSNMRTHYKKCILKDNPNEQTNVQNAT